MEFRLFVAGGFAFFAVILGSCGVMGDPIPYTQTESYRKEQQLNQVKPEAPKEKAKR
jgi:hypothetical protein